MANSVGILIGVAGISLSMLGGLALGQYAVSGVDPTKAAAYYAPPFRDQSYASISDEWRSAPVSPVTASADFAPTATGATLDGADGTY